VIYAAERKAMLVMYRNRIHSQSLNWLYTWFSTWIIHQPSATSRSFCSRWCWKQYSICIVWSVNYYVSLY